jgi:hypothetical protein
MTTHTLYIISHVNNNTRMNVNAYFAGHDHIMQVINPKGSHVHYYGSGAGAVSF